MNKPLKEIPYQQLREVVWNFDVPASFPHGLDKHLRRIHDATFKELVKWSVAWLSLLEYEDYLEANKEAIERWEKYQSSLGKVNKK
jgi:hypothetical protein